MVPMTLSLDSVLPALSNRQLHGVTDSAFELKHGCEEVCLSKKSSEVRLIRMVGFPSKGAKRFRHGHGPNAPHPMTVTW